MYNGILRLQLPKVVAADDFDAIWGIRSRLENNGLLLLEYSAEKRIKDERSKHRYGLGLASTTYIRNQRSSGMIAKKYNSSQASGVTTLLAKMVPNIGGP